jgi:C4-dicarboxylate transporter, DctM subunit
MTALVVAIIVILMASGVPLAAVVGAAALLCVMAFTHIPPQTLFQQLYQGAEYDLLQAVIFFIVAGNVMTRGSLAERLIRVGQAVVGGFYGGLAITAVLLCMFFAAISGSSPATVVAIGTIMIPALIKSGYDSRFSIGLLTTAGSLGIMIPPSIPMIIWGVVMGVSITKQFTAGFLPGILIGLALMTYSYVMARRHGWRVSSRISGRDLMQALKQGAWGLFMPFLVLGGIYSGAFTATEAAAVAFVYALLVELFIHRSIHIRDMMPIFRESVLTSAMLLFIIANASVLSYYFSIDEIPLRVAEYILQFIQSRFLFLLIINIALLIMGCFMDIVSAMLVLGPVLQPLLQKFEIDPIHFGIIMVLNIEIGFLTPPFGVNLFVSSGITGKDVLEVARSVGPYLAIMLGMLLLITYVPWISLVLTRYIG